MNLRIYILAALLVSAWPLSPQHSSSPDSWFFTPAIAQTSNGNGNRANDDFSVTTVMQHLDSLYRSSSSRGTMRVDISNKRYKRTLEMHVVTLGSDYSLITILSPRKEKGIATLRRKDEIWTHMPKINRNIRLPPSMMSESWMGSDLTNDDLVREVSWKSDYTHSRVAIVIEEPNSAPSEDIACFSSTPKPEVPVTWSRVETCIQKKTILPVFQNFFDEKKRLARKIVFSEVRKIGERTIPTKITVLPQINETKGQSTSLTYLSMSFDIPIDESTFQVSRLGDGK